MKNTVLIIALNKYWVGISRLPSGLDRAGFTTYALCPFGSYLSLTKYLKNKIIFPTFTYSRSKLFYVLVIYALIKFDPEVVIPGDEEAILVLQKLSFFLIKIPLLRKFAIMIRSSLSSVEFDEMILSKSMFLKYCQEWRVKTPKNLEVSTLPDAIRFADEIGYPVVLKMDTGYGGAGVSICHNLEELCQNFRFKNNTSRKYLFKNYLKRLFFISIFSTQTKISIQQYIKGKTGHISFSAMNGNLLAFNSMLGLQTYPSDTGPSSVSQGFNDNLLEQYTKTVMSKLSYTGFGSLDFIFDEVTNSTYVIELNARPTPTCHFSSTIARTDLCSAFYKALHKEEIILNPFKPFIVAMFPNEKKRDPKSLFLKEAYHDIPLEDVQLMNALDV